MWLSQFRNKRFAMLGSRRLCRAAFRPQLESLEERCLLTTFPVVNTNDSGAGSLRQAIMDANNNANSGEPDIIDFNIPGNGVQTIAPLSALPSITDPVII